MNVGQRAWKETFWLKQTGRVRCSSGQFWAIKILFKSRKHPWPNVREISWMSCACKTGFWVPRTQCYLIIFLPVPCWTCPSVLAPCHLAAMLRPPLCGTVNPMAEAPHFGWATELSQQCLPRVVSILAVVSIPVFWETLQIQKNQDGWSPLLCLTGQL